MRPGPRNLITDVAGLRVGNASDDRLRTGVTVLTADAPFVASVQVSGGAPGTRETDLLDPSATVDRVDALVLSGGSAFGLQAADAVALRLRAAGRGYPAAGHRIPIVPAAILFDRHGPDGMAWEGAPWADLGARAFDAAAADFALGSVGAGTGAITARVKGGLGSASAVLPGGGIVGALVAANPWGDVLMDGGPEFRAGGLEQDGEFGGLGPGRVETGWPATKGDAGGNTVIAVVATDLALTKAEAKRLAVMADDGIARAVAPSHTPADGDVVFAVATGRVTAAPGALAAAGHAAAVCLARAIARACHAAEPRPGDLRPAWRALFDRT